MSKVMKKVVASALSVSLAAAMLTSGAMTASAEASTGVGLSAHALTAYREGWQYVWGGTSYGTVDCSGLIYTYNYVGGNRVDMLSCSSEWGYVSNGIPRIHGLGLHMPGHVGVYIGSGMAVDARDEYSGVVYHNAYSSSWVEWFKVAGVSYPENGWVLFDGDSFYYENGQYVASTSRTIDGVTYTFDSAGVSNIAPPSGSYQATDYSTATAESAPSYYEEESEEEESVEESSEEESSEEESEEESYEEESYEEESEEESVEEESYEEEESEEESYEEESSEEESEEESYEEESYEEESVEESVEEESVEEESYEEESSEEESIEESSEEESVEESSEEESSEEESVEESSEEESVEEESEEEPEEEISIVASLGDENDTVTKIQTRLYELGYLSKSPTGYFGGDTVDAVMLFQNANGLEVTGEVDELTLEVLESDEAVNNFIELTPDSYDDENSLYITALQNRLAELGYFYGDVTGYYGKLTVNAVEQFQINNGLDATGTADVETLLAIFSRNAEENPNAGSIVYGMSGDSVVQMIARLKELRYLSGTVSDEFNDDVLEAVHLFQQTAGFEISDLLTPEQIEFLLSENAPKAPDYSVLKLGFSGNDVAELQAKLALLKYYDGKTSGVYTQALEEAVKRFQKDHNLPVTGIVDAETLEQIKSAAQHETTKAGDKMILKTATVANDALSHIADTPAKTTATSTDTDVPAGTDQSETGILLGFAGMFAALVALLIGIEVKKRKDGTKFI